ncbi:MAG: hypothetical protein ACLFQK_05830 [Fibrobacterota bacterium]
MSNLRFSPEEAHEICWERNDRFEVISREYVAERKGVSTCRVIVLDLDTGKYYRTFYQSGCKPSGVKVRPFTREEPIFMEVEIQEEVREEWVPVEEG